MWLVALDFDLPIRQGNRPEVFPPRSVLRKQKHPLPSVRRDDPTTLTLPPDSGSSTRMKPTHPLAAVLDHRGVSRVQGDFESMCLRNDRPIAEIEAEKVRMIASPSVDVAQGIELTHREGVSFVGSAGPAAPRFCLLGDSRIGGGAKTFCPIRFSRLCDRHSTNAIVSRRREAAGPARSSSGSRRLHERESDVREASCQ